AKPAGGYARWVIAPLDMTALQSAVRPWVTGTKSRIVGGMGLDVGLDDLIGRVHPVAMPLKPGHIAQALAGGVMNGKRITPDVPGMPDLLIKGVFQREYRTVDEKTNKKTGEVTALVQVQQPLLRVSVLDLSASTYHDLLPGTTPTGAASFDRMSIADILVNYGQSLGRLIAEQCPPLHDPANPAHQIDLPTMARAPFRAQREAVQAGLKLLAAGHNPFGLGEVGTGKSLMAQAMAYALSPAHYATTRAEMARLGLTWDARLRPVQNVLVLCPPHLLTSWRNEIAATLPGASVVVLDAPSQVPVARWVAGTQPGAGMTFSVLSRETAKLGHSYEPGITKVNPVCPRCGAQVGVDPKEITEGRAVCGSTHRIAADEPARLAVDLASLLVTSATADWLVQTLPAKNLRRLVRVTMRRDQQAVEMHDTAYPSNETRWQTMALRGAENGLQGTPLGAIVQRVTGLVLARLTAKEDVQPLLEIATRLLISVQHTGRNDLIADTVRTLYTASLSDTGGYGRGANVRAWARTLVLLMDGNQSAFASELQALGPVPTGPATYGGDPG
ncbi:MAG: hypothetical protein WCG26_15545, partial [Chloroflexales bacterium]